MDSILPSILTQNFGCGQDQKLTEVNYSNPTSHWLKSRQLMGRHFLQRSSLFHHRKSVSPIPPPPTHSKCKTLRVTSPLSKSYSLPLLLQVSPPSIYICRDSGDVLPLSLTPINCLSNVFLTNFLKTDPFKTKVNFSMHRSEHGSHNTLPLSWFSLVTAHPFLHI